MVLPYTPAEKKILARLNTPGKVQDFLNSLSVNFERTGETCMSPRRVLKLRTAHCMEGALMAAACFEYHGRKPLLLDLRSDETDCDHVVALFQAGKSWGAVSKTNHAVLRYREPVYRDIRELVMSYFHEYFRDTGKKTLRDYSVPYDLSRCNDLQWRTSAEELMEIPYRLDRAKHVRILTATQIKNLRLAEPIEIEAGKLVEQSSVD